MHKHAWHIEGQRTLTPKRMACWLVVNSMSRFTVSLASGSFSSEAFYKSDDSCCLVLRQSPSKIMNSWRHCCSYICSHFELFRVCGIRSHFSEAVSHQYVLNEICLLGFSILLTVIILVNTEAFNKGDLALLDSRSNNRIVSSLSEHPSGSPHELNITKYHFLWVDSLLFKYTVWGVHVYLNVTQCRKRIMKHRFDLRGGESNMQSKAMASNFVDRD